MLENWLRPINWNKIVPSGSLETDQLGHHIKAYQSQHSFPEFSNAHLAIIGLSPKSSDPIRKALYALSNAFQDLNIIDLGNLRKQTVPFAVNILAEIQAAGIFPLIIGDRPQLVQALFHGLKLNYQSINLSIIDEHFPIHASQPHHQKAYLNDLYLDREAPIFHTSVIGFQSYFVSPSRLQFGIEHHFDLLRLGLAKADIKETEPLLRDADLVGFHLASLSSIEFPAVADPNPSGFSIEELCRMCRYAGMSDKLKGLSLLGYEAGEDKRGESAKAAAQMIWYFCEGFYNRKSDFPVNTEGLVEYIVDLKQLDYQLTFWKSQKTGRWWIQVPVDVKNEVQRHRLVPCSYGDYQKATNQELPQRLINVFHRFGL